MNKKFYKKLPIATMSLNRLITLCSIILVFFTIVLINHLNREKTNSILNLNQKSLEELNSSQLKNKHQLEIEQKSNINKLKNTKLQYFEYLDLLVYEDHLKELRGIFTMDKSTIDFYNQFSDLELREMSYINLDKKAIVFLYKRYFESGDLNQANEVLFDAMALGVHYGFIDKMDIIEQKIDNSNSIDKLKQLQKEYLATCEVQFMLGIMTEISVCIGRANSNQFADIINNEEIENINDEAVNQYHKLQKRRMALGLKATENENKLFPIDIQALYFVKKGLKDFNLKTNWGLEYLDKTYDLYYPTQDDKFYLDASKL